jgi:hypothetical protein
MELDEFLDFLSIQRAEAMARVREITEKPVLCIPSSPPSPQATPTSSSGPTSASFRPFGGSTSAPTVTSNSGPTSASNSGPTSASNSGPTSASNSGPTSTSGVPLSIYSPPYVGILHLRVSDGYLRKELCKVVSASDQINVMALAGKDEDNKVKLLSYSLANAKIRMKEAWEVYQMLLIETRDRIAALEVLLPFMFDPKEAKALMSKVRDIYSPSSALCSLLVLCLLIFSFCLLFPLLSVLSSVLTFVTLDPRL